MRVVRLWPRLPRRAVGAPSLAVPWARLDGAEAWWEGSLPIAGVGTGWSFKVLSNLNPSYSTITA